MNAADELRDFMAAITAEEDYRFYAADLADLAIDLKASHMAGAAATVEQYAHVASRAAWAEENNPNTPGLPRG